MAAAVAVTVVGSIPLAVAAQQPDAQPPAAEFTTAPSYDEQSYDEQSNDQQSNDQQQPAAQQPAAQPTTAQPPVGQPQPPVGQQQPPVGQPTTAQPPVGQQQPPVAQPTTAPPPVGQQQPPVGQPPAVQPPAVQPPPAPNGLRANFVMSGRLVDLDPAIGPFDGASASVSVRTDSVASDTIKLSVTGAIRNGATATYGAHLHTGPCQAMNGAAAGPHVAVGAPPSPNTEVWLDLALDSDGQTDTEVTVPFALRPGSVGSVVIHALPTAANGTAGARIACLPVRF